MSDLESALEVSHSIAMLPHTVPQANVRTWFLRQHCCAHVSAKQLQMFLKATLAMQGWPRPGFKWTNAMQLTAEDQWISGSEDEWISGSVDQWISGSVHVWCSSSCNFTVYGSTHTNDVPRLLMLEPAHIKAAHSTPTSAPSA
jgi:hypothetical protein